MPGRRGSKLTKEQRMAQNVRILDAYKGGLSPPEIARAEKLGEATIRNIIGHHIQEKKEELTRPYAKAFIHDQCLAVIREMQAPLKAGDSAAATAVIKAADRYAKITGADEERKNPFDPDNPINIVGRLTWLPPTES